MRSAMSTPPLGDRVVGRSFLRTEAAQKVSGALAYTADIHVENLLYGVMVSSPIAKGTIEDYDLEAAYQIDGVVKIFTSDTLPKLLFRPELPDWQIMWGQTFVPMENREIVYAGQPIAYVVAETLEAAEAAAERVHFKFKVEQPDLPTLDSTSPAKEPETIWLGYIAGNLPSRLKRGEGKEAIKGAEVHLDGSWTLSFNHHNPMEVSATIAIWDAPDRLRVYETTQGGADFRNAYAKLFGLFREQVEVISSYIGGGFGCKGPVWPHSWITVSAAKAVRRPVKLIVSRAQMYSSVGFREEQRIDLSLGASREGRLVAMHATKTAPTCSFADWTEPSWYPFTFMYACPNLETDCRLLPANVMSPTFTRAPGEAPGMFVQECALNELAAELKIDPIQIRLENHADVYPIDGSPWSSKRLKDCYSRGAEIVGWSKRSPMPRSMRDGDWLIGMGMSSASHTVYRQNAYARIAIRGDGIVHASSGASDIGTGTVTFMRQLAAEEFGLSIDKVTASIGETHLRDACQQGGASLTASLGSAILNGCRLLKAKIISMSTEVADSPLHGCDPLGINFENGWVVDTLSKKSEKIASFLRRSGLTEMIQDGEFEPGRLGEVRTGDEARDRGAGHRGMHSWGAVFATVAVDPGLGLVRVRRLTGVYACGRILNPLLAKSQLIGGMTWGVSQAMFESSYLDRRTGRFANANFAEYMVPVNLDIPTIEVEFLPDPDPYINPAGVKGVGEIGITGVAAAIVDAVWNATGKRLRNLPITPESLL